MLKDCVVCGNETAASDEAWDVGLCHACAFDVMAPLVGKAIVLDGQAENADRSQHQVIHRFREAVKGAKLERAGAGRG